MNPLDMYLLEKRGSKTAAPIDTLKNFGQEVGKATATGAGAAVAGATVAGVGLAAAKIWDAVTKSRDFRAMMSSPHNGDLHEFLATRPKEFNESFGALRSINPAFTKEPMIAGTYMRRMMQMRPENAGGVLIEALGHRKAIPESPMGEAYMHGAGGGVMEGLKGHARAGEEKARAQSRAQEHQQQIQRSALGEYFKRTPHWPRDPSAASPDEIEKAMEGEKYLYGVGKGTRQP